MLQIALPILHQLERNRLNHVQALSLVISTSSPMVFTILLMGWLWEVHSSFMDQLVGGQELCFFSHMSSLKRFTRGIFLIDCRLNAESFSAVNSMQDKAKNLTLLNKRERHVLAAIKKPRLVELMFITCQ